MDAFEVLDDIPIRANPYIAFSHNLNFTTIAVPIRRDDLLRTTMCGILFHAHLGKNPNTESAEFIRFLSRLRDANARRGQ